LWKQSLTRGIVVCLPGSSCNENQVDKPHGPAPVRKARERKTGDDEHHLRPNENPLSVDYIGEVSRWESEYYDGQSSRESYEPESER
jgi:hypothetical protein